MLKYTLKTWKGPIETGPEFKIYPYNADKLMYPFPELDQWSP